MPTTLLDVWMIRVNFHVINNNYILFIIVIRLQLYLPIGTLKYVIRQNKTQHLFRTLQSPMCLNIF